MADRCLLHPHIVQVWDAFWSAPRPKREISIVYELMGSSLSGLLDDRPPTVPQVRTTTLHVCSALSFLHEMGFIHTDVKPPNILVNDINGRWYVKLGDLGCCVEA